MSRYKDSAESNLHRLVEYSKQLNCSDIAANVLRDPRFKLWSAAGSHTHHHFGEGGLVEHTLEVYEFCNTLVKQFPPEYEINPQVVFLGVLFHDYGKCWDYDTDGKKTPHARNIHHISRSAIMWELSLVEWSHYRIIGDEVLHVILSHHGCREYGSPVSPRSREAWLVHFCDNISAKMNDCLISDRY